jgi:hypothetical protein
MTNVAKPPNSKYRTPWFVPLRTICKSIPVREDTNRGKGIADAVSVPCCKAALVIAFSSSSNEFIF